MKTMYQLSTFKTNTLDQVDPISVPSFVFLHLLWNKIAFNWHLYHLDVETKIRLLGVQNMDEQIC